MNTPWCRNGVGITEIKTLLGVAVECMIRLWYIIITIFDCDAKLHHGICNGLYDTTVCVSPSSIWVCCVLILLQASVLCATRMILDYTNILVECIHSILYAILRKIDIMKDIIDIILDH